MPGRARVFRRWRASTACTAWRNLSRIKEGGGRVGRFVLFCTGTKGFVGSPYGTKRRLPDCTCTKRDQCSRLDVVRWHPPLRPSARHMLRTLSTRRRLLAAPHDAPSFGTEEWATQRGKEHDEHGGGQACFVLILRGKKRRELQGGIVVEPIELSASWTCEKKSGQSKRIRAQRLIHHHWFVWTL